MIRDATPAKHAQLNVHIVLFAIDVVWPDILHEGSTCAMRRNVPEEVIFVDIISFNDVLVLPIAIL